MDSDGKHVWILDRCGSNAARSQIYSGASGRPGLVVHELFRPLY
jgi:hypothetical protein